jgi:TIR domain-containing protein
LSAQTVQPRGRSANIFINYRREDSSGHAGRLFDALSSRFPGRLFMDIDNLQPGVDFVDAIEQAVASCDVLLVVIGREWLTVQNAAGKRRLDDPADFVRLELESALARNIRVIPVLVQDAPMPSADELPPSLARLARRNAIELSDARWAYDVHRLADTLQQVLGEADAPAPPPNPPAPDGGAARSWVRRGVRVVPLVALAAAIPLAVWLLPSTHQPKPIPAPPAVVQGTTAAADLHPPDGAPGKAGPSVPATEAATQTATLPTTQGATQGVTQAPGGDPSTATGSADGAKSAAPDRPDADGARDEAASRREERAAQTRTPPDEAASRRAERASHSRAKVHQVKPRPADEPYGGAAGSAAGDAPRDRPISVEVVPPAPQVNITAPAGGEKVGSTGERPGARRAADLPLHQAAGWPHLPPRGDLPEGRRPVDHPAPQLEGEELRRPRRRLAQQGGLPGAERPDEPGQRPEHAPRRRRGRGHSRLGTAQAGALRHRVTAGGPRPRPAGARRASAGPSG